MSNIMPTLFIGHGSPMNAIEDNDYSRTWQALGAQIPIPKAIVVVSAHWATRGFKISSNIKHPMIYDMYGFADELYQVQYPALNDLKLVERIKSLGIPHLEVDDSWGIDHGVWSVLKHMYPQTNIPIVIMSTNIDATPLEMFELGQKLKPLSSDGILVMGSGNIVHNLRLLDYNIIDGYDFALSFDQYVKDAIINHDYQKVIDYNTHPGSNNAIPTVEHFYPILVVLGASNPHGKVIVYNESISLGSISMTSYLIE
ncbi:MAG: 4,5-DOPA dioxygenase extradiol [Bacilli bacterium]